ncbi:MAG: hypothetical protein JRI77_15700, partial [Deltaproteobacteria bacterium]|nr:hypothetical protein [Deltaproteobacteria bacterium]
MTLDYKEHVFKIRVELLICLLLVLVTSAAFLQLKYNDFINYDDGAYVSENRYVKAGLTSAGMKWAFTATRAGNWHPLTWLSHMLDCELYGLDAGAHHLTNLFFHIANTLLLFWILRTMTAAPWQSGFVAALFAIHPMHVESVAWISERKDVLSTFFWMLALWAYVRYTKQPGTVRYLVVILLFILGLMAKPMLVTLPFVLLLLDYWPFGRFQITACEYDFRKSRISFSIFLEKIPLLLLSIASSIVTLVAQKRGGALRSLEALALNDRIANALVSYIRYIGKMIWPVDLAVLYPHPHRIPGWQVTAAFLLLLSISYLAVKARHRYPYFTVGWLWYMGTLIPVIG